MDPSQNTRLRQQIETLRSSNRSAILEILKELRSEGDVSVLPELFNLLLVQEDTEIQDAITALLNDLKDNDGAEILARAIGNPEYEQIRTMLVAACWQNGLSYSKHIAIFTDVMVSGSYGAAIEAFTVIEEAVGELEQREREKVVLSLKSGIHKADDQKKALIAELVRLIESYDATS